MGARLLRHGLAGLKVPAPQLWLRGDGVNYQDSARTTLATADGDVVGSLSDNVATNHFTAAGTARPVLKTGANGKNGLPVIRFDGANDILTGNLPSLAAAQTLFLAIKKNSTPVLGGGDNCPWSWDSTGPSAFLDIQNGFTNWYYRHDSVGGLPQFPTVTVTDWNILVVRFNSASSCNLWAGGGAAGTGGSGAGFDPYDDYDNVVAVGLGGMKPASMQIDIDVAEVRWFSSALSLADLNAVKNDLATKWAITTPDMT